MRGVVRGVVDWWARSTLLTVLDLYEAATGPFRKPASKSDDDYRYE